MDCDVKEERFFRASEHGIRCRERQAAQQPSLSSMQCAWLRALEGSNRTVVIILLERKSKVSAMIL